MTPRSSLKRIAIPLRKRGSCFIGALQEGEQRLIWRGFMAQIFIKEDELTQSIVEAGLFRLDRNSIETFRRRSSIAIESGFTEASVTRPEAGADDLMRVCLCLLYTSRCV